MIMYLFLLAIKKNTAVKFEVADFFSQIYRVMKVNFRSPVEVNETNKADWTNTFLSTPSKH